MLVIIMLGDSSRDRTVILNYWGGVLCCIKQEKMLKSIYKGSRTNDHDERQIKLSMLKS